jgi:thiamine phosphate synthase YjbQ (UPF0047 family)
MRTHQIECIATTKTALDFVDVTDDVQSALTASGIASGQVTVFAPHRDCAILINERESGLHTDIRAALERLGGKSTVVGSKSVVLPAMDGELRLGQWQRVLLLELDHAQERSIIIQIVGE